LSETLKRRSLPEEEEVRLASAIGGSKADQRNGGSFRTFDAFRPNMLQTPTVATVPDFFDSGMRPQVVDVPVRLKRDLEMMGESGANASWPERAADIDIKARLKL